MGALEKSIYVSGFSYIVLIDVLSVNRKMTVKMMEDGKCKYVGSKVKAEEWGISQATITKWCRDHLIDGAEQDDPGRPWRIPADAKCPVVHRKQQKI